MNALSIAKTPRSVKRHSNAAIFMHWFNAVCWILLLATGFGLLANKLTQPVAQWWVNFMEIVFKGGGGLLDAHVAIAITWVLVFGVMTLIRWKFDSWPFLKEITAISPKSDVIWMIRKGFWLVIGPKSMRKIGLDPNLPPQGFYNAGQKYVAIAAVLCSLGLVSSGGALLFTREIWASQPLAQWLILLHFCCASLMVILLPVHIYMAALAPGEMPALKSMFTASVPLDFVKHHNPLWFDKLNNEAKVDEPNKG